MPAVSSATDLGTVLKLALPIGSRLVSGYPTTPVSRVSHLRTRPPIFSEIGHSEMLLVSTTALANSPNAPALDTIIERLTEPVPALLETQDHRAALRRPHPRRWNRSPRGTGVPRSG